MPVFRTDHSRSGTFGAIFLQRGGEELSHGLISHEYGHTFQQLFLGPLGYLLYVFIPSAGGWSSRNEYYSRPWESFASMAGGDVRHNLSQLDYAIGIAHLFAAKFFGPFSYLFGLW